MTFRHVPASPTGLAGPAEAVLHAGHACAEAQPVRFSDAELLAALPAAARRRGALERRLAAAYAVLHTAIAAALLATGGLRGRAVGTNAWFAVAAAAAYLALRGSDPGLIRSKRERRGGDHGVSGVLVADTPTEAQQTFCRTCNIVQPLRARHCLECERCVYLFDHHCWWAGVCVGGGNKFRFLVFLAAQLALTVSTFVLVDPAETWDSWVAVMVVRALCVGFGFWNLRLLVFHTLLAAYNTTSFECMRREKCGYLPDSPKNPYSRGLCRNLLLLCRPQVAWPVPEGGQSQNGARAHRRPPHGRVAGRPVGEEMLA